MYKPVINPDMSNSTERTIKVPTTIPFNNSKSGIFIMEIWKDIPEWEGYYQASTHGRIRSLNRNIINKHGIITFKKGVILSFTIGEKGYYQCIFSKQCIRKGCRVNRIIALTFIPNPENKPETNHKDCNKLNNRIENLEWVTRKENHLHSIKNNRRIYKRGEEHANSILTNKQRIEICKLRKKNVSYTVIAKMYNVCRGTVYKYKSDKILRNI